MARPRQLPQPLVRIATSPFGRWWFLKLGHRVDPFLLRRTNGRVSLQLGAPVLLLTTRGAKSGQPRETPLAYATDGERIVLIASKAGAPKHPAWYHNLRANPEVEVIAKGRSGRYVARDAGADEYDRLWSLALEFYPGYDEYQRMAGGRKIPVVVLEPKRD
jgi:deazaflavin-dependent oxidoreductase (nitroreductase family)